MTYCHAPNYKHLWYGLSRKEALNNYEIYRDGFNLAILCVMIVPMLMAANSMLTMYSRQKEVRNNMVYLGFGFLMGLLLIYISILITEVSLSVELLVFKD